jgi:hypothetical protein
MLKRESEFCKFLGCQILFYCIRNHATGLKQANKGCNGSNTDMFRNCFATELYTTGTDAWNKF